MRRLHHLVLCLTTALLAAVLALLGASPASAHNALEGSDPADGAVLAAAPAQVSFDFKTAVPLDTASVQVIDASGARTDATLTHGATDDVLVATLPPLGAGETTLRWRLVGPDGHPLTGRVSLTVSPPATTVAPRTAAASTPGAAAAEPATTTPPPPPSTPADAGASGADAGALADELPVPDALRWVLRYGSYLAVMAIIGIVLADRYIWRGAARDPILRQIVHWSLVTVAILAVLQLLVVASDIADAPPWAALGSLDAALNTGAGIALIARVLLAGVLWALLFRTSDAEEDVRRSAIALSAFAILGTWAWAGHSSTQRWAELGMPVDIAHHAAAAVWIAGLLIVGVFATRRLSGAPLATVVERLSTAAGVAVAAIVVTGVVQSLRLVGSPGDLFAADHGTYLAVKLLVVAAMLGVAALNRRSIRAGHLRSAGAANSGV
ncbi:MAG TPA: copper resistance protein CopC, partial [Ilumatobacteraceae bacterium]|nr:copper resistance protein CopC [Ilumatobacteraceae bacterium]